MRNLFKLLILLCPAIPAAAFCLPFPSAGNSAFHERKAPNLLYENPALPVRVTLFAVSYNPKKDVVNLHWITSSVEADDQFIIERAVDSVHFIRVGETTSNSTSKTLQHYYFDDPKPLSGKLFYRLHLVGADGSDNYTNIVSVFKEITKMEVSTITKDTAAKTIYFSIAAPQSSNANITMVDYTGKVLKSYFIALKKGSNFQSAYIGNLSPGIYFLQVNDNNGGGSFIQKFSSD